MKYFSLVSGVGKDNKYELVSFDNALLNAGLGNYNIVRVSSILPPLTTEAKFQDYPLGKPLFTAFASKTSSEKGLLSAAVSVAVPTSQDDVGVIMEYSSNSNKEFSIQESRFMVELAMKNRAIPIKHILSVGCEHEITTPTFVTVFSAVILW